MVEDTIKAIRETEKKAEEMIADAKASESQLLEKAKQEAAELESCMIEQAKAQAAKARDEALRAGKEKLEETVQEAGSEIKQLKETAKSREKEVVQAIVEALV